jgi:phospholipase C
MRKRNRRGTSLAVAMGLCLAACGGGGSGHGGGQSGTASNIKHVVIVIQENISFDAYFATYCQAPTGSNPTCTAGSACCEAGPATDPGTGMGPVRLDDLQLGTWDPDHTVDCEVSEINGGRMDRYITSPVCGDAQNFAYADDASVGAYRDLARQSALADRYFQPVVGESSSNDMYFARAAFVFPDNEFVPDSIGQQCSINVNPRATYTDQTLGDLLADADVPWAFYIEGYDTMRVATEQNTCPPAPPECGTGLFIYPCVYDPSDIPFQYYPRFRDNPEFMRDYSAFSTDLAAGELPDVSFVKAIGYKSEHAGYLDTISAGVTFVTELVDQVLASPYADDTLILLTYDESGGFFDHVAPPPDSPVDGKAYGPRVPTLAIGRFARANTISHVTMEHSSIVRFIEWNWLQKKTGQLGTRDAVVHNIGSLLDPAQTGTRVPQ